MKKICKDCGRLLDTSCFTPCKNLKDGYENKCRECRQKQRKTHENICLNCGKKFYSAKKHAKYCSVKCSANVKKDRIKITCSYCGKNIEVVKYKYEKYSFHYCNQQCRTEHLKTLIKGENNHAYDRVEYKCDGCSKEIKVIPSKIEKQKYIFCSNSCYKENIGKFLRGKNNPNYIRVKCICATCGKEFYRKPSTIESEKVYCSVECHRKALKKYNKLRVNKIKTKCAYCEKEIEIVPSRLKYNERIYCSIECKNKGWSKYYCGENSPNWNFQLSKSERIVNRKYDEYYQWRKIVYKRDSYTCKCCGDNKGGNLVAHHIYNYSENKQLRTDIDNGITLCKECHKSFHDLYGYRNNNAEQLNNFMKEFNQLNLKVSTK